MFKLTIFLCVFLLAQNVQGGFFDNVGQRAKSMVSKIDDILTKFENQIGSFKLRISDAIKSLGEGTNGVRERIKSHIDILAEKIKNAVSSVADKGTDVTPCGDITMKFRDKAMQIYDDISSCVSQPFELASARAGNISALGDNIRNTLQSSRKEIIECADNINSFKETVGGLSCMKEPTIKVGSVIAQSIPTFTSEATKALALVAVTRPKLELCASSSVFSAISDHYNKVLSQFGECARGIGSRFEHSPESKTLLSISTYDRSQVPVEFEFLE